MKKILSILLIALASLGLKANSYTVTISGFTYSSATLAVSVGDVITISASATHPLTEVSQATCLAKE